MGDNQFKKFKSEIEQDIKKLAKTALGYVESITTLKDNECQKKSFYQCQNTSQKYCVDNPRKSECFTKGVKISYNSGIRLSHGSLEELGQNQKCIVCSTAKLDSLFRQIKQRHGSKIQSIYIGLFNGVFRRFPTQQQVNKDGKCLSSYDPRKRLWYVGAGTGPKNIFLLMDISQSIKQEQLPTIKKAVQELIRTLTFNDFISIVFYSQKAEVKIYESLTRANDQIKEALISTINTVNFSQMNRESTANVTSAFEKVNELMGQKSKTKHVYGPPCQSSTNIVILISGSEPDEVYSPESNIFKQWEDQSVKFFSYNLGNASKTNFFKKISCSYDGISFNFQNKTLELQLASKIRIYQKILQTGINIDFPIWTQPYNDAFNSQRMITMAMPLYRYANGRRRIIGAAGIDVSMQILSQYSISEDKIITQFLKCTITEFVKIDKCTIQNLRDSQSKCNQSCQIYQDELTCPVMIDVNSVFERPAGKNISRTKVQQAYSCCTVSLQLGVILVAISALLFVLILIISLLFYRSRRIKQMNPQTISEFEQKSSRKEKIKILATVDLSDRDNNAPLTQAHMNRKMLGEDDSDKRVPNNNGSSNKLGEDQFKEERTTK